ncbi:MULTISPECIES: rhodanese-like domain-containing protein [Frankia]|uniref:Thiosulfate sulfurtransferase (Partial match) n=1 Tax=Frankia alni (strain DSM 45986 / CECT 9034 / ACN14a) TaxID=326424 RepID=Q0RJ10_FRAAA|nr:MULTISPECIES: rhodanese-like domain-containing protein [Frankia]CAJ62505.1 thiosulfate sulfurtransferase (partial match) [Frankia alni ACN14a]
MSRRYVVIGAGAVGATIAAELNLAGIDVVVVARGANLAALRAGGLRYIRPPATEGGPADERRVDLAVAGGPDEVELRSGDVLVLATKSQDSEALLAAWAWQPVDGGRSTAAESLPVVLLQNGIENARTALRRFAVVIDAMVLSPSSHLRPGEVISPAAPLVAGFLLGRAPGGGVGDPVVEAIAADLRRGASAVRIVDDIGRWKAGKLLGNLAYNLDALYPPSPRRDAASAELVAEARRAFDAAGIDIADLRQDGGFDHTQLAIHDIPGFPRQGSSTWQSLARGGSVESDFLNGEIVLLARLHGLTAPVNAGVQRRIAVAARLGTPPGGLGDADLAELLASGRGTRGSAAARQPGGRQPGGEVLVDAKALHDELGSALAPLLLDVRWALGDPHGHDHYREGHLPGAVYVDLDTELAAAPGGTAGRHPLPALADLQRAARSWGLTAGRPVVVYDDNGGLSAARAWWLLRWAGVADVRILDGALGAWRDAGLPIETGEIIPLPGDIVLEAGHLPVLDADTAAAVAREGILLDARAPERYRGEVEPVDPRAGHIPGAVSASTGDNLDAAGRFLPAAELRARFLALGASAGGGGDAQAPIGVYCGSGVTASHEIAALAVAGFDAALFPGSWSAWSSDPARPVATGPR